MIMTSFYFSIGGILALGLYGIYRYARTKERAEEMITVKGFLGDGLRFAGRILTAIMLAGVLLVPTAMALLGRSGSKGEKNRYLAASDTADQFGKISVWGIWTGT